MKTNTITLLAMLTALPALCFGQGLTTVTKEAAIKALPVGAQNAVSMLTKAGSGSLKVAASNKNNWLPAYDKTLASQLSYADRQAAETAQKLRINRRVLLLKKYRAEITRAYHLTDDFLNGYYARRVERYLANPMFKADAGGEGFVFRGMYITVDELANILQRGFELDRTSWNVGSKNGSAINSFSSSSGEAMTYIFHNGNPGKHPGGIGVVFKVRQTPDMTLFEDPILNSTGTIYHSYQNVPATQIVEVSVYGKWGMELLDADFRANSPEGILEKAVKGQLKDNEDWIHQFDIQFLR